MTLTILPASTSTCGRFSYLSASFKLALGLSLVLLAIPSRAEPDSLTVKTDQPGGRIPSSFYGLMTEEINHAYDGGLYAELIQNRVFKDNPANPVHWSLVQDGGGSGALTLDKIQPLNDALPVSAKLEVKRAGRRVGLANDGYWGIAVKPKTTYRVSFYAKANAEFKGPLTVSLESADGSVVHASEAVDGVCREWRKFKVALTTGEGVTPSAANRFVISCDSPGTLWFTLVSVMPPTYKNRPNGLRPDLMEMLAALKPAFLRFPAGCYLQGLTVADRFDWKKTIGPLENRPGHACFWGYRASTGVGLHEFLEWCEDLNMEPILDIYNGYSMREAVKPGPDLKPFVQDALDEIEYVTGDVNTRWGAERAKSGHPKPFHLRYVEVGNEDFFDRSGSIEGRFAQFYDAIKAKYPHLTVIASGAVKGRKMEILDNHHYEPFNRLREVGRYYDKADRKGMKYFIGEWATIGEVHPMVEPDKRPPTTSLREALGDAIFWIGMERNADVVSMQCYAPLLVNINPGRRWAANLIAYDALGCFAAPTYYVQRMFNQNRGDVVLPVELTQRRSVFVPKGGVGVGTWETQAEFKDAKVTCDGKILWQRDGTNGLQGCSPVNGEWKAQGSVLSQVSPAADVRLTAGDANWTDYTYEVKARKTGGKEGFLVMVHATDKDNFVWLNLGGWGNTKSAIERCHSGVKSIIGESVPMTIETGRWYDIKVEVKGQDITACLDGKQIHQVVDNSQEPVAPLHATASRDDKTGDVIIKVVNISGQARDVEVNLQGMKEVKDEAIMEVLTGNPGDMSNLNVPPKNHWAWSEPAVTGDMNSMAEPTKVVPKSSRVPVAPRFKQTFPANSVSVLRIGPKR